MSGTEQNNNSNNNFVKKIGIYAMATDPIFYKCSPRPL